MHGAGRRLGLAPTAVYSLVLALLWLLTCIPRKVEHHLGVLAQVEIILVHLFLFGVEIKLLVLFEL